MKSLLEAHERIKLFYSKNEFFIIPLMKFMMAFVSLTVINGKMGYMSRLDNLAIVLIVGLVCSFLPPSAILVFAAAFSVLHMYELAIEVALVGLCLYLILFLVFFRFAPKTALVVILMPLLFAMKIPYVMPIAVGLVATPVAAVSVGCGVIVHYFLGYVTDNATAIHAMEDTEAIARLRLVIDGLLNNKEMLVIIAAFTVTVIVVYVIRRLSIDYAWTIAMVAGAIVDLILLLIGDLIYDTNVSVLWVILGTVVAVAVAKVLEFFRFCVDYSRTEKVQFEDDEYYYYVKAIPKMNVAARDRTVKTISAQRSRGAVRRSESAYDEVTEYAGRRESAARSRSVVTERTSVAGRGDRSNSIGAGQMTINSSAVDNIEIEDVEELNQWE